MCLPSGSALELAMGPCVHAFTSGIAWPDEPPSERFDYGNAVHDVSESALTTGRVDLDAIARARNLTVSDARRLRSTAPRVLDHLDRLVSDGWALWAEVPVAYHVARGTARIMQSTGHRDYSDRRPGELTATIDVIGVREGRVLCGDWKSGRWITRDGPSWQVRFGGLAVARLVGADEADVALWYVDEAGVREDAATLDGFALDETAHSLRQLWARLHGGPTPPVPGAWCTAHYCKLLGHCAATRAALAEVRSDAFVVSEQNAARVWDLLPQAEAAIKAAKEQIRAMAARRPIPLANGRRLVVVEQTRETVALTPSTVDLVPEGAREVTTSAAAIKRALGKRDGDAVIAALRDAGAVRVSTYSTLKEIGD